MVRTCNPQIAHAGRDSPIARRPPPSNRKSHGGDGRALPDAVCVVTFLMRILANGTIRSLDERNTHEMAAADAVNMPSVVLKAVGEGPDETMSFQPRHKSIYIMPGRVNAEMQHGLAAPSTRRSGDYKFMRQSVITWLYGHGGTPYGTVPKAGAESDDDGSSSDEEEGDDDDKSDDEEEGSDFLFDEEEEGDDDDDGDDEQLVNLCAPLDPLTVVVPPPSPQPHASAAADRADTELSSYEKKRLANIERNEEIIALLGTCHTCSYTCHLFRPRPPMCVRSGADPFFLLSCASAQAQARGRQP